MATSTKVVETTTSKEERPGRFFISYTRHKDVDARLARYFYQQLEKSGQKPFLDERMQAGTKWAHAIPDAIRESDVFICLVSEATLENPMVQQEVTIAHGSNSELGRPKIVPVRVQFEGDLGFALGAYLNTFQWAHWSSEADSDSLLRNLLSLAGDNTIQATQTATLPSSPATIVPVDAPAPVVIPAVPLAADVMIPEVIVCFLHPERRQKLVEWRRWSRPAMDSSSRSSPAVRFVEAATLQQAVEYLGNHPERKILLLDGFEPHSAALREIPRLAKLIQQCDVIYNAPEWENFAEQAVSASLHHVQRGVTSDDNVTEALRKLSLRIRAQSLLTHRQVASKSDLQAYFSLRYDVWSAMGYLPHGKTCPRVRWELDYTDRTSFPVGFFAKQDGKLLGLSRLVYGIGEEDGALTRTIQELIQETGSEVLSKNFRFPDGQQHPFDILGELQEFKSYYRTLVKSGTPKAELSRVIVDPHQQKLGLGEVIVDTMCDWARIRQIRVMFLACHTKHEKFYGRCGFRAIPHVTGTHFLSYQVPCIAMEQRFSGSVSDTRVPLMRS